MGENSWYNTTDSGIVIDDDGHSVGGGETTEPMEETDQINTAVEAGTLIKVEPQKKTRKKSEASE